MNKKVVILYPSIAVIVAIVILIGNFLYNALITKLEFDILGAIQSGKIMFIKKIISYGYPVNRIDASGSTMLIHASESGNLEIVQFLYKSGAKVNIASNWGGLTPLSAASLHGNINVMKYLIEKGARIGIERVRMSKQCDFIEISALHFAASSGQNESIKVLLMNGADVDVHGKDNYTPLMAAAGSCHSETVTYLLSMGADTEIKNKDGTAFEFAKRNGCKDVMELLEKISSHMRIKK